MAADELTLADLEVGRTTGPCKVAKILALLTDKERETVQTALAGPKEKYPHRQIAAVLSKRVWAVSDHAVRSHRVGTCTCER